MHDALRPKTFCRGTELSSRPGLTTQFDLKHNRRSEGLPLSTVENAADITSGHGEVWAGISVAESKPVSCFRDHLAVQR